MRDHTSSAAEFDRMEREIRDFYRRERLEDAAWFLTILGSVIALIGVLWMVA